MLEIDETKLVTLEKYSAANPEGEVVLGEIAKRIYHAKSPSVSWSDELKSNEIIYAIQEGILVKTSDDAISFTDSQYFLYFWAKSLILSRLEVVWVYKEEFWDEIDSLQLEYVSFEQLQYIEVMLLILLQRHYGKDILESLVLILKTDTERDHWLLLQTVSNVLPYLHLKPERIINFLEDLHDTQIPYIKVLAKGVEILATNYPDIGRELWETWSTFPDFKSVWLITAVAVGLARSEGIQSVFSKTLNLVDSHQESLVDAGVRILGLLPYSETNDDQINNTLVKFDKLLKDEPNIQVRQALAYAYGQLVPLSERAQLAIQILSTESLPEVQAQVALILFNYNKDQLDKTWFQETLLQLTKVKVEQKDIINNLDFILTRLASSNLDCVKKFLENWILEHEAPKREESLAKLFDMLLLSLVKENKPWFEKLLSSWFIADDKRFHLHIQEMLHHLTVHGVTLHLDPEIISEWTFKDTKYVLMKILGFVADNKNLCHLTFSVLQRTPEDETINMLVRAAFRDYIAYNYPGATREILTDKTENGTDTRIRKEKLQVSSLATWTAICRI